MTKSMLFVESQPAGPEQVEEYHRWHDEVHLAEILTIDGFTSARRWQTDGDTFVTMYEIDTDIPTAQANFKAAYASGKMSRPVGIQLDPPPVMRYLSLIGEVTG